MYEVTVKIGGNASKYWASLEFDDAKGKTHRKEIARERSATKSSNTLQALIDEVLAKDMMTLDKDMMMKPDGN